jgi:hypothetical protein
MSNRLAGMTFKEAQALAERAKTRGWITLRPVVYSSTGHGRGLVAKIPPRVRDLLVVFLEKTPGEFRSEQFREFLDASGLKLAKNSVVIYLIAATRDGLTFRPRRAHFQISKLRTDL